jgi:hypothetical protein
LASDDFADVFFCSDHSVSPSMIIMGIGAYRQRFTSRAYSSGYHACPLKILASALVPASLRPVGNRERKQDVTSKPGTTTKVAA